MTPLRTNRAGQLHSWTEWGRDMRMRGREHNMQTCTQIDIFPVILSGTNPNQSELAGPSLTPIGSAFA